MTDNLKKASGKAFASWNQAQSLLTSCLFLLAIQKWSSHVTILETSARRQNPACRRRQRGKRKGLEWHYDWTFHQPRAAAFRLPVGGKHKAYLGKSQRYTGRLAPSISCSVVKLSIHTSLMEGVLPLVLTLVFITWFALSNGILADKMLSKALK